MTQAILEIQSVTGMSDGLVLFLLIVFVFSMLLANAEAWGRYIEEYRQRPRRAAKTIVFQRESAGGTLDEHSGDQQ